MRGLLIMSVLVLAGCGLGADKAAHEIASAKAAELSAAGGWTQYEILGVGAEKGVHTFFVNAVKTSEMGEETPYYWRIDISDVCGAIRFGCSDKVEMTALDAPGAFAR